MPATTDVTVPVPSDRIAEFYRCFATWIDGRPAAPTKEDAPAPEGQELDAAVRWWKLLKPSERKIFGLWIDTAPSMITASEMIDRLGLSGPREIPGILSWTGRKGRKAGFAVRWSFRYDPATQEPLYGIEDRGYAELILEARSVAEEV